MGFNANNKTNNFYLFKLKKMNTTITLRISKSLKDKLEKLAVNDKRSLGDFIRLRLEELTTDKDELSFEEKQSLIKQRAEKFNS